MVGDSGTPNKVGINAKTMLTDQIVAFLIMALL